MNKIYRLIWNSVRQAWAVTHEAASARGKPASARKRLNLAAATAVLAASTLAQAAPPAPNTLPTGGQVVAGQAAITQSGSVMNIQQATNKAIVNWNTFNIGAGATVNFQQPNASAIALNRVLGSDPSAIYGNLNANGQVFLINPNGVLFGAGSHVDVAGLVASTLSLSNNDFLAGNNRFTRDGAMGSVINQGDLTARYVALLAPEVRNEGAISARMGTVALAAGDAATLNLTGNSLIDVQVDQASINTLVENKHLIKADEGTVILAAQSARQLLGSVINSGAIEAQGITTDGGKVRLTASSAIAHSGSINVDAGANGKGGSAIVIANLDNPNSQTNVSGSITAKGGSASGDGGFIETSGSHLKINDGTHIDTTAANGKTGQWLLDPADFVVGTDISGSNLGGALDSASVTIDTTGVTPSCTGGNLTCGSGSGTNGDIIFNEAVRWTQDNVLTLNAHRNIVFNQSVVADVAIPGPLSASIQMTYGLGGTGVVYTTPSANWFTPFVNDPMISMVIQDNTSVNSTPVAILATHMGSPLDLYLAAKGVPIYVQATSGSSTYDGNSVPFLPSFSLDASGVSLIDIIPPLVPGVPTWTYGNGPETLLHANTYTNLLYGGGLSSTAYNSLAVGTAAATWTVNTAPATFAVSKTYSGDTSVAQSEITVSGVNGETLTLGGTGTATANSKDVSANGSNYLTALGGTLALVNGTTGTTGLATDYDTSALGSYSANNDVQTTQKTVGLSASKTYNGNTTLTGTDVTLTTGVGTETLTYSGATANSKDVGAGNYISMITLADGSNGGLASNYTTPTLDAANAPVTINKADLTLTGTRAYNGLTSVAGGTLTAHGAGTETFTVTGSGNASNLLSKDFQTSSTLNSLTGLGLGAGNSNTTLSSNYNPLSTTGSTYDITRANATVTGNSATYTYDGQSHSVSGYTANLVNNEPFSVLTSITNSAATGTNANTYANIVNGNAIDGNYNLTFANGTLSINRATAKLVASKTYNGTTDFSANQIAVTGVNNETLTLSGTGMATAFSMDAAANGNNYLTSLGGLSLANGSGLASNYNLPALTAFSTDNQVLINQAVARVSISGERAYDATPIFKNTDLSIVGSIQTQDQGNVTLIGQASVNGKDVDHYTAFLSDGYTLALTGSAASNYTLVGGAVNVDITQAKARVEASKIYDGTPFVDFKDITVLGVNNEKLTLTGGTGQIMASNAPVNQPDHPWLVYSYNGAALGNGTNGEKSSNYEMLKDFTNTGILDDTAKINITQRPLTISAIKTYDGTTTLGVGTVTLGNLAVVDKNITNNWTATASDAHVATPDKYITAIDIGTADFTDDKSIARNYKLPDLTKFSSDNKVTIERATAKLVASKPFDGTNQFTANQIKVTGVNNETLVLVGNDYAGALAVSSDKDKDRSMPNYLISLIGLYLADATDASGGKASDYEIPLVHHSVQQNEAHITEGRLPIIETEQTIQNAVASKLDSSNVFGRSITVADQNIVPLNSSLSHTTEGTTQTTEGDPSWTCVANWCGPVPPPPEHLSEGTFESDSAQTTIDIGSRVNEGFINDLGVRYNYPEPGYMTFSTSRL